jgi:hypothetical protein
MLQISHIEKSPSIGGVTLTGQILIASRLFHMNILDYLVTNYQAGYKL